MIDFVAYFSTAQDQLGYIVLGGYGIASAAFVGGPALAHGTYKVEGGALVPVDLSPTSGKENPINAENAWPCT